MRDVPCPTTNHVVNSEIQHHKRIFELYKIEHLRESAIAHKEEMHKVVYPDDLRLLSYDELDINLALNSMSSIRVINAYKYQRANMALEMDEKLDSLIFNPIYALGNASFPPIGRMTKSLTSKLFFIPTFLCRDDMVHLIGANVNSM